MKSKFDFEKQISFLTEVQNFLCSFSTVMCTALRKMLRKNMSVIMKCITFTQLAHFIIVRINSIIWKKYTTVCHAFSQ